MIHRFFQLIGTPAEEELGFIASEGNGRAKDESYRENVRWIRQYPKMPKQDFQKIFSKATEEGADLLERVLVFSPEKRPTAKECLEHPFFAKYHDDAKEPVAGGKFEWAWDEEELSLESLIRILRGE